MRLLFEIIEISAISESTDASQDLRPPRMDTQLWLYIVGIARVYCLTTHEKSLINCSNAGMECLSGDVELWAYFEDW